MYTINSIFKYVNKRFKEIQWYNILTIKKSKTNYVFENFK